MAQLLRPAVYCKMLGTGSRLQIFSISLDSFNKGNPQPGGQIRILAVGFMASPPSGIPENVYIGRPKGQPLIDVPVILRRIGIVLGP